MADTNTVSKDQTVNLNGRDHITYDGLLDLAHQKGLKSIRTQLCQVPDEHNGHTAICTAEVEMEDGKVFTGIGDANPRNVNRNIANHLIRMAETRSKARALRDAVNVGEVSVDELGGDDADAPRSNTTRSSSQSQRTQQASQGQQAARAGASGGKKDTEYTPAQEKRLQALTKERERLRLTKEQANTELKKKFPKIAAADLSDAQQAELFKAWAAIAPQATGA